MGASPSAELIWGIPITRFDEEDELSPLFVALWDGDPEDVDDGDYRDDLPDGLKVEVYGHYEDPEGPRCVLTHSDVASYKGDAWTPTIIDVHSRVRGSGFVVPDEIFKRCDAAAEEAGIPVKFYESASWWLVASYG